MTSLTLAMEYCKRGFSIIPIKSKDKSPPLIAWEDHQARKADEAEIKGWFEKWGDINLGLVTGEVSGIIVIDIDSEAAKEGLKKHAGDYDLEAVPRSRTGRGWQLFFRHPGGKIQNRAGILPNLDFRGDGGYVVVPPSTHPNGETYEWEVPLNGELPKLPQQLFSLITSGNGTGQEPRERFNTTQALAGVPEGERDETLFKLACKLRSADVPKDMAERLILEAAANCKPSFPELEARAKVENAYKRYPAGGGTQEPVIVIEIPQEDMEPAETTSVAFPEAAWSGIFGQWRDIVAPCTEAPLEFLYASFLVALGMMLGRNVWRSSPRPIYPNFYVLLLGQTGDSRKSTALWFAEELLRYVGEDIQIISGIVSTEGLVERLAQGEGTKGLGYVDELRSLMCVGKRKGTQDILPKLNSLYYCPAQVSVDRVKNPTTATHPFFSLIGATAQDYVDDLIGSLELNGGFLNRFLLVSGEEQPPNPDAEEPSEANWMRIAAPLREVCDRWAGNPTKMEWGGEAKELWREFYVQWKTKRKTWYLTAQKLTARTHEHVQKIACVYAAVNGEPVITAKTLATAITIGGWLEAEYP